MESVYYGDSILRFEIPERWNVIAKGEPNEAPAVKDEEETINAALRNPLGSSRLQNLTKGKKSAVIITSDYTRVVPKAALFPIQEEPNAGGLSYIPESSREKSP